MKYKALLLDVDGTLVVNRRDALPAPRVLEAVTKAKERIYVGIATGRGIHLIEQLLDILDLNSPCITLSGLQIIDPKTHVILFEQRMNKEDALQIITIANKFDIAINVEERGKTVPYHKKYDFSTFLGLYTEAVSEDRADTFIREVSFIPTVNAHKTSSWEIGKVHVGLNHALATKQHAVLEVAKILHIQTQEIIGVGDHYNDFPLLMACGLKVAMGNAVDDLKAIADYIAPPVEKDGVADVIEKFIL